MTEKILEYLGLNIILIGGLALIVLIYLIVLINKRRREKFLHQSANDAES